MRMKITLLVTLISLTVNSVFSQSDLLELCSQHVKQAELPYSAEREQRFIAFDNEQKAIQEQLKNQPPTRQIYRIPVVFHVLHYGGDENISNEQIYDAMEVLNRDFRKLNPDTSLIDFDFSAANPNAFATAADIEIEFVLATKAPDGTCFNGITRTISPTTFSTADGFVQLDAVKNGNDVYRGIWPAMNYMNVIVAKNIGSAAGYTFLPPSFNQENMYGSIWMNSTYVGRIGTGSEARSRTLTHEVGHWLNLYHTWGPTNYPGLLSNCDWDDEVEDTPNTIGITSCKISENSCGPKANVENYMDYSYCSKMFTHGQKDRMRAALLTLQRKNLWTAENQVFTGIDGAGGLCAADFIVEKESHCVGESVQFKDNSTQGATSWSWEFEGGTPNLSTAQNPVVKFDSSGTYLVRLTVSDGTTTLMKEKTIYINASVGLPYFEGFEYYSTLSAAKKAVIRNLTPNAAGFELTKETAATDETSIVFRNYYTTEPAINEFISPAIDLSELKSSDKVTLSFKYAYRKKNQENSEKILVSASKDCGETWQVRKELSGVLLSNEVLPANYLATQEDFKTVHTTNIGGVYFQENFQFKIQFFSEGGNNLYLDDINLYSGTPSEENIVTALTPSNQQMNWTLYPNPANESVTVGFVVQNDQTTPLKVVDITGKTIFENMYKTPTGKNEIILDVSNFSKGIYLVKLGDKTKKLIVK